MLEPVIPPPSFEIMEEDRPIQEPVYVPPPPPEPIQEPEYIKPPRPEPEVFAPSEPEVFCQLPQEYAQPLYDEEYYQEPPQPHTPPPPACPPVRTGDRKMRSQVHIIFFSKSKDQNGQKILKWSNDLRFLILKIISKNIIRDNKRVGEFYRVFRLKGKPSNRKVRGKIG